jgi:uncharacterized protein YndB with AHSA1/START domain
MASSMITPDQDSVVTEIEIGAPPERVFQALISREQALQWGGNQLFELTAWEMEARPGGKWRFISKERRPSGAYSVSEFVHHGEVVEIDPPHLLVYTWFANWHEPPSRKTVVRWELTPTPTGTRVKVTHSGLAALPGAAKGYNEGWPGLLHSIKRYLESGREPAHV